MTVAGKILLLVGDLNENGEIERIVSENGSFIQVKNSVFEDLKLDMIRDFSPDVILLSVNLLNDLENYIIRVSALIKPEIIPLIVISSKKNQDWLKTAFALGAWDFIDFSGDKMEMNIRITSMINISHALKQKINHKELLSKKTDELAVRNNEFESLSQITSKLHCSLIIINTEKNIEWVNEEGYMLYDEGEKLSKELLLEKIYRINTRFESSCHKCFASGETVNYQSLLKLNHEYKVYVQTTLFPITIDGEVKRLISVESDISLLKEKEELLENSRKEFLYMIEDMDKISINFENQKKEFEKQKSELESEKKKSDELLYNILPVTIAEELKHFNKVEPKYYSNVSVMFADFQSFTKSCENLKFYELVKQLNTYFVRFDEIIAKYRIEKIKTIGDAYMCAGGVPVEDMNNPIEIILASLEIQKFVTDLNNENREKGLPFWNLRLGIHTGPVYAGVVGKTKIAYDIWGDTVNVASRMESGGEIGKVNISEATYQQIKDYFDCSYRGEMDAKNKGKIKMYFAHKIKTELAGDSNGLIPNEAFASIIGKIG